MDGSGPFLFSLEALWKKLKAPALSVSLPGKTLSSWEVLLCSIVNSGLEIHKTTTHIYVKYLINYLTLCFVAHVTGSIKDNSVELVLSFPLSTGSKD